MRALTLIFLFNFGSMADLKNLVGSWVRLVDGKNRRGGGWHDVGEYLVLEVWEDIGDDELWRWYNNEPPPKGMYGFGCLSINGYLMGKRSADSWLNNYKEVDGEYVCVYAGGKGVKIEVIEEPVEVSEYRVGKNNGQLKLF